MTEPKGGAPLALGEFVPLMALIVSLGALSIDAMLPALLSIASDLHAQSPKDAQLVISTMFLGFALGQLFYGPLSDAIGRKNAIYWGTALFLVGCGLSASASAFWVMLVGRLLQGTGAAATRIVTMALIRDQYSGEVMARVMSLIMGVFVLVPAVAPALGQAVVHFANWRAIFAFLAGQGIVATLWLWLRQPESLPPERRRKFSVPGLLADGREVFRHGETVGYTLAVSLVFANLVGYLATAPLLFRDLYAVVDTFPLYFSMTACSIGLGSFVNSRLVVRWGSRRVSLCVLAALTGWSGVFLLLAVWHQGRPSLPELMVYLMGAFFCIGPLMGNLNALAMKPVGHIAGTAAAVIGSISTFVSLAIGSVIGWAYAQNVFATVLGFAVLGSLAFFVTAWTRGPASTRSA